MVRMAARRARPPHPRPWLAVAVGETAEVWKAMRKCDAVAGDARDPARTPRLRARPSTNSTLPRAFLHDPTSPGTAVRCFYPAWGVSSEGLSRGATEPCRGCGVPGGSVTNPRRFTRDPHVLGVSRRSPPARPTMRRPGATTTAASDGTT